MAKNKYRGFTALSSTPAKSTIQRRLREAASGKDGRFGRDGKPANTVSRNTPRMSIQGGTDGFGNLHGSQDYHYGMAPNPATTVNDQQNSNVWHNGLVNNPNPNASTGVTNLRALLGLAPDPDSDAIWADRFAKGTHTMEHAQAALRKKMDPNSPMHITNPGSYTPDYIMPAESPAAKARARLGLTPDADSDAIWAKRLAEGTHTQEDMIARLRGKAGPLQSRAADRVAMEYDPQESAFQREIERIARERDYATGVQERYGSIYDDRISSINEQTLAKLAEITGRTGQIYDQGQGAVQQAYQGAQGSMQGASADVLADLQAQMEALGLQAAGPDPVSDINQQTTNTNARFGTSGAAGVGNLANLGVDMEALSGQAEGNFAQEGAQTRQHLANQVMAAISDIQRGGFEGITEVQGLLSDLAGKRGADLRSTVADLEEQQYDRSRQVALDKLYEEIQRNTMNIQNEQLGLSKDQFAHNKEMDLTNLQLQKDQLNAQIAAASSPAAQLQAELELAHVQAKINKINHDMQMDRIGAAKGSDPASSQWKGQVGVQQFAEALGDPQLYNKFMEMQMNAMAQDAGTTATEEELIKAQIAAQKDPQIRAALQEAMNIFYGNHASYAE